MGFRNRHSGAAGRPGPAGGAPSGGSPVPARLRQVTDGGPGPWLAGTLHLAPGSLLWQPDAKVKASPVDLTSATTVPMIPGDPHAADQVSSVDLQTPSGRVHLELDPVLFEMTLELVNGS